MVGSKGEFDLTSVAFGVLRDLSLEGRGGFQAKKHFKIIGKGFGDAGWILDDDSIETQADQGECHCHAMVVVGLNSGRFKR